ncbi:MAG: hypothetical protein ABSA03_08515 [Streptosporangiaceae bacterium]|jgi:hypothetical protein
MTINDTVTRPSGTLIVEFDPETASFTFKVLSISPTGETITRYSSAAA